MKPENSCTVVLVALSNPREVEGTAALWVEVVSTAALWWDGDFAELRAWLWVARAAVESAPLADLEAVCRRAERCRASIPWPLAWAVRAASAALVLDARRAGLWPAWRALPFALSLRAHPISLAAEILEESARVGGRNLEVARRAWVELAARHGVVA